MATRVLKQTSTLNKSCDLIALFSKQKLELTLIWDTCVIVRLFLRRPLTTCGKLESVIIPNRCQLKSQLSRCQKTFLVYQLSNLIYCNLRMMLWSGNQRGKRAKLHTVAASNNRHLTPWSFYHCLFAPLAYRRYSSRTSRLWWIAHSTSRPPSGWNNTEPLKQIW